MSELVLRNAALGGRLVDVAIDAGVISAIGETGSIPGDAVDDLAGAIVLPAFADPHAHLDKALTAGRIPNPSGDLLGAIDAWVTAVPAITSADIETRATAALDLYAASGVTAVRTHSDVGPEIGLRSVEALIALRAATDLDLQVCGLVMWPLCGPDGAVNRGLLGSAVELGIDLIGGAPALDPDPAGAIGVILDLATDAGLPVDLHIDETLDPEVRTLELLARAVIDRGFPHPVTAGHCVSLGMQPEPDQNRTARLVAEAGIAVVANPQTNLFLQGWGISAAMPRGLTAIDALRDAGVLVAAGGDNVQDPFNPLGRGDPLDTAALLVAAGHLTPADSLELISGAARRVMGLSAEPALGAPADLVAIAADGIGNALATGGSARRTYKAGRLIATQERVVHRFRG